MIERYNAIAIRGLANFNSSSSCSLASDKYTNRKLRLYGVADDAALNGILSIYGTREIERELEQTDKKKIICHLFLSRNGIQFDQKKKIGGEKSATQTLFVHRAW